MCSNPLKKALSFKWGAECFTCNWKKKSVYNDVCRPWGDSSGRWTGGDFLLQYSARIHHEEATILINRESTYQKDSAIGVSLPKILLIQMRLRYVQVQLGYSDGGFINLIFRRTVLSFCLTVHANLCLICTCYTCRLEYPIIQYHRRTSSVAEKDWEWLEVITRVSGRESEVIVLQLVGDGLVLFLYMITQKYG